MDFPFTPFRATLFTTVHSLCDFFAVLFNGALLYLIFYNTSRSFRSYSIILGCVTLCELLLALSAGLAMVRVIPIGHGLVYQFHGLCHKISPQLCMDVHAITAHCTTYNNLLMPLSFWYRHYVLTNGAPKRKRIALYCLILYIPVFITAVMNTFVTSDPLQMRQLLVEHQPGSLYPDDPAQAAIQGYENVFAARTIAIFLWLCVPVFPAYCISLYFRCRIMRKLRGNLCLSSGTIKAQRNLVKALTIQAILPLCMMGQATIYLWRQFQLPYANYAPYFEEWVFLSLAMVSLVSPCITIYYVLPYRKRVTSIFNAFYYQRGKFRIGGGDILTATADASYRISTHRTRSYF